MARNDGDKLPMELFFNNVQIGSIDKDGDELTLHPRGLLRAGLPRELWLFLASILRHGLPEGIRERLYERRFIELSGSLPGFAERLADLEELPFSLSLKEFSDRRFIPIPYDLEPNAVPSSELAPAWFIPEARMRDERFSPSFSGVQDKFTAVLERRSDDQTVLRHARRGEYGNVIVKPSEEPSGPKYIPEMEHLAMRTARRMGLDVPRTWLFREAGCMTPKAYHYAVERFDFEQNEKSVWTKIPVLEAAAFVHDPSTSAASKKYDASTERLFESLESILPKPEMSALAFHYLFGFLIGNGDMHLKNFSLIMDGRGDAVHETKERSLMGMLRLAPMYDMLSTRALGYERRLGLPLFGSHHPTAELVLGFLSRYAELESLVDFRSRFPEALREEFQTLEILYGLKGRSWEKLRRRLDQITDEAGYPVRIPEPEEPISGTDEPCF